MLDKKEKKSDISCPACNKTCKGQRGLRSHLGQFCTVIDNGIVPEPEYEEDGTINFTEVRKEENKCLKQNGAKLSTRSTFSGTMMKPTLETMIEKTEEESCSEYPFGFSNDPNPQDFFFAGSQTKTISATNEKTKS